MVGHDLFEEHVCEWNGFVFDGHLDIKFYRILKDSRNDIGFSARVLSSLRRLGAC